MIRTNPDEGFQSYWIDENSLEYAMDDEHPSIHAHAQW
jgi:hypothetical protein